MPDQDPLRRWVWMSRLDVGHLERGILAVLCDYANDATGEVACSVDTIAERLRTGSRSIRRGLDALMARGIITRVERHARAPAVYRLNFGVAVWQPRIGWQTGHQDPGHQDPGHQDPGHGVPSRMELRGHSCRVEGTPCHPTPGPEPEPHTQRLSHAGAREGALHAGHVLKLLPRHLLFQRNGMTVGGDRIRVDADEARFLLAQVHFHAFGLCVEQRFRFRRRSRARVILSKLLAQVVRQRTVEVEAVPPKARVY